MSNEYRRDAVIIGALSRSNLPFDIRQNIYKKLGMLGSQRVRAGRRIHQSKMRNTVAPVIRAVGRNRSGYFGQFNRPKRLRSVQAVTQGSPQWMKKRVKKYLLSRKKARYPRNKWRKR